MRLSALVFVIRHLANNLLKGKAEWNIKNAAELLNRLAPRSICGIR